MWSMLTAIGILAIWGGSITHRALKGQGGDA